MSFSDRILGLLGGAMVLGALVLLVLGGERDIGAAGIDGAAPRLEIISPSGGEEIEDPLVVVFSVDDERALEMRPGGWGVGDHHLHLEIDGVEIMPRARDLERLAGGDYRWSVGTLNRGPHALRLLWSGPGHRPIPETATPPVRVHVQ